MAKLGLLEDPSMGMSTAMASNIDIAFSVAYGLGQFLWGMSADRFGPRRVVLGGMLASSVVAVAMGLSYTVVFLGVFFFIQGLCESTGWAPLTKNLGFWFSFKERGRVGFPSTSSSAIGPEMSGSKRSRIITASPKPWSMPATCPRRRRRGLGT